MNEDETYVSRVKSFREMKDLGGMKDMSYEPMKLTIPKAIAPGLNSLSLDRLQSVSAESLPSGTHSGATPGRCGKFGAAIGA